MRSGGRLHSAIIIETWGARGGSGGGGGGSGDGHYWARAAKRDWMVGPPSAGRWAGASNKSAATGPAPGAAPRAGRSDAGAGAAD